VNPSRNRKGASGSPLPKANASEFYPNHWLTGRIVSAIALRLR